MQAHVARRGTADGRIPAALILSSLVLLAVAEAAGVDPRYALPAVASAVLVSTFYRVLFGWRNLIIGLITVILFLPMGRYVLPGSLPFQLEPYRLFVAFILAAWTTSLLIDPRVRARRSGFEGPAALLALTAIISIGLNDSRISDLGVSTDVTKRLTIFASFFIVFYLIVSVARTHRDVDAFVRTLVTGGGGLAFLGLVEASTGFNIFNHLHAVLPFLRQIPLPISLDVARGGRLRIYGSAEHPIALSAVFVMLLPLALYLIQTRSEKRWWLHGGLLLGAAVATESRTGITMLLAVVLTFLCLRPRQTRRLWPALLPILLILHFTVPGAIGSLSSAFFPSGGLVAEEQAGAGTHGSGRLADLGPALHEYSAAPFFGQGFGSRVTDHGRNPAPILDDEWLGTLLETGAVGVFAWIWLFGRYIRRLGREARRDQSSRGSLLTALVASVAAFPVGMFTFDAFSFTQATFLLFVMLAIGAVVLALDPNEPVPLRTRAAIPLGRPLERSDAY